VCWCGAGVAEVAEPAGVEVWVGGTFGDGFGEVGRWDVLAQCGDGGVEVAEDAVAEVFGA
jgi:hypothetical protein